MIKETNTSRSKKQTHKNKTNNGNTTSEVFSRKGILKICSKFTGKHPCFGMKGMLLKGMFKYKQAVYFNEYSRQ